MVYRSILLQTLLQSALRHNIVAAGYCCSLPAKQSQLLTQYESPLWCRLLLRFLWNHSTLWSWLCGSWRQRPVQWLGVWPSKGRGKAASTRRHLCNSGWWSSSQWCLCPNSKNVWIYVTLCLSTVRENECTKIATVSYKLCM